MAANVERRAACGASYNPCASGATPCKFETRQPARPAGKAMADRQFQRRVGTPATNASPTTAFSCQPRVAICSVKLWSESIDSLPTGSVTGRLLKHACSRATVFQAKRTALASEILREPHKPTALETRQECGERIVQR